MPTGTPSEPADERGRPLFGAALEAHLRKQAELDAAAGYAEDIKAVARIVCRLAGRALRMPAPDALAALGAQAGNGGQADALRTLRAAGFDPEPRAQRWAEEAPLARQASSRAGNLWDDPEHDPRVIQALREGQPLDEVADLVAQITAERRREREEAEAALPVPPDVLWTTREGRPVRESRQATPFMAQHSIVRRDVPELGSEPVEPVPPGPA